MYSSSPLLLTLPLLLICWHVWHVDKKWWRCNWIDWDDRFDDWWRGKEFVEWSGWRGTEGAVVFLLCGWGRNKSEEGRGKKEEGRGKDNTFDGRRVAVVIGVVSEVPGLLMLCLWPFYASIHQRKKKKKRKEKKKKKRKEEDEEEEKDTLALLCQRWRWIESSDQSERKSSSNLLRGGRDEGRKGGRGKGKCW